MCGGVTGQAWGCKTIILRTRKYLWSKYLCNSSVYQYFQCTSATKTIEAKAARWKCDI